MSDLRALEPCRFCGKSMMERHALWPSEGDTDAIIHAEPTDCPVTDYSIGTADEGKSVRDAWNSRARDGETVRAQVIEECAKALDKEAAAYWKMGDHETDAECHETAAKIVRSLSALPSPMPVRGENNLSRNPYGEDIED